MQKDKTKALHKTMWRASLYSFLFFLIIGTGSCVGTTHFKFRIDTMTIVHQSKFSSKPYIVLNEINAIRTFRSFQKCHTPLLPLIVAEHHSKR